MCIICDKNQQNHTSITNKNELQLDLSEIKGLNPPNDHHLKTSDLYRIEDIPEQFKNTGKKEILQVYR